MLSRRTKTVLVWLVTTLILTPAAVRACGGEPSVTGAASWQAYVRWCGCMGGKVDSNFNDAQRQGGCRLPSGSGSSSGATSGADSIGTALGTAIGKELGKALFGDPAEKARKEAAARELALAQQRAAEEAAAAAEWKRQEDYTRLRGALKFENFDGDSGGLLLKGVDAEPVGGLVLKPGDSGSDLALKVDTGDSSPAAPNADPMVVDARNVPSGLPKALDNAIATAYPDVPPGVSDRVRKGFQAVTMRDWKVAKAWFQDALNLNPGNLGLRRLVALTDSSPPSNPQTAIVGKPFTDEPIPPGSDKRTYAETSMKLHSHEAWMKFLFPDSKESRYAAPTTDKNLELPDEDDFLLVNDPATWRKKHPDWWKDVPEMVELRNRATITSTSPDGRQVQLPHPSDPDLLFNVKPKPVAPAVGPGMPAGSPHN